MFLIYNVATGAQIGPWVETPVPENGQAAIEVPGSAKVDATIWSPARRSFVEPLAFMNWQIVALYTTPEKLLIYGSNVAEVRTLVAELTLLHTPLRLDSTFHVQGTALLVGLGLLTEARAARVLEGLPPLV